MSIRVAAPSVALFRFRPHPSLPILFDLDVNHVRPTADGTVLDILLGSARRCIDGFQTQGSAIVLDPIKPGSETGTGGLGAIGGH